MFKLHEPGLKSGRDAPHVVMSKMEIGTLYMDSKQGFSNYDQQQY